MDITARSTKAEIIDHACELVDTQQEQIAELKEQRTILVTLCAVLFSALVLF